MKVLFENPIPLNIKPTYSDKETNTEREALLLETGLSPVLVLKTNLHWSHWAPSINAVTTRRIDSIFAHEFFAPSLSTYSIHIGILCLSSIIHTARESHHVLTFEGKNIVGKMRK